MNYRKLTIVIMSVDTFHTVLFCSVHTVHTRLTIWIHSMDDIKRP